MKLISMVNLILDIDWLTTTEFCRQYNIPPPRFYSDVEKSVASLLTIDAIKHRYFLEYAKLLNRDLSVDMFSGDKPLFVGFTEMDTRGGNRTFTLNRRYNIVKDGFGFYLQPHDSCDGQRLNKIESLVGFDFEIDFKLK